METKWLTLNYTSEEESQFNFRVKHNIYKSRDALIDASLLLSTQQGWVSYIKPMIKSYFTIYTIFVIICMEVELYDMCIL